MRAAIVNGKSGFVAATRNRGAQEDVFVLFDGDGPEESGAGWFPADQVTLYGYGDQVQVLAVQGAVLDVYAASQGEATTELGILNSYTGELHRVPADSITLRKVA